MTSKSVQPAHDAPWSRSRPFAAVAAGLMPAMTTVAIEGDSP